MKIENTVHRFCRKLEKISRKKTSFSQAFENLEKQAKTIEEVVVLEVMRETCKELSQEHLHQQRLPRAAVGM